MARNITSAKKHGKKEYKTKDDVWLDVLNERFTDSGIEIEGRRVWVDYTNKSPLVFNPFVLHVVEDWIAEHMTMYGHKIKETE